MKNKQRISSFGTVVEFHTPQDYVFHHGTGNPHEEIRNNPFLSATLGPGVYVTTSYTTALHYGRVIQITVPTRKVFILNRGFSYHDFSHWIRENCSIFGEDASLRASLEKAGFCDLSARSQWGDIDVIWHSAGVSILNGIWDGDRRIGLNDKAYGEPSYPGIPGKFIEQAGGWTSLRDANGIFQAGGSRVVIENRERLVEAEWAASVKVLETQEIMEGEFTRNFMRNAQPVNTLKDWAAMARWERDEEEEERAPAEEAEGTEGADGESAERASEEEMHGENAGVDPDEEDAEGAEKEMDVETASPEEVVAAKGEGETRRNKRGLGTSKRGESSDSAISTDFHAIEEGREESEGREQEEKFLKRS